MSMPELMTAVRAAVKDRLLTTPEAAQLLQVTPGTLENWRVTGRYELPFVKVGRRVRYRESSLVEWLNRRTSEAGATA